MFTVPVRISGGRSYEVLIGRGIDLAPHLPPRILLCAHDARVAPPRIRGARYLRLPAGESSKTFAVYRRVIDELIAMDDGRPLALLACGGGAVGDLAGFAASTYRRGIPFMQIPTTLLAMVDASVGGKTAINHPRAKNMVGTFHQPVKVVADLDRLRTLPPRQYRSGLAEVVKHGLIGDAKLFEAVESDPSSFLSWDASGVALAVIRSVRLKADVVRRDERETQGVRECLNLGHTLGHALEAYHGYRKLLHGEAVSIGIAAAARVSMHLLGYDETARVDHVLSNLKLPVRLKGESASKLIALTKLDKKRREGKLRMTLLEETGRYKIVDAVDEKLLREAARAIGASR